MNEERNEFCSYIFLLSVKVFERLGQKPFYEWIKALEYYRPYIIQSGSQMFSSNKINK